MKTIRTAVFCAIIPLFSLCAAAQNEKIPINEPDYNKPRLFENLPARIPVSIDDLNTIISAPVGRPASLKLSGESLIQFDGDVVSVASNAADRIQSVVLRSTNFNGARFTLSKIMQDDGSYSFVGRIISFQHGDLYELKKEAGGMVLVKRNYHELVNE